MHLAEDFAIRDEASKDLVEIDFQRSYKLLCSSHISFVNE